jgi:hypothetical protein
VAAKRSPVVSYPKVGPDIIPGLRIALEIVAVRKKTIADKLSMLDIVQELSRIEAMLKLEIEFASKVGKPLKKEKTKATLWGGRNGAANQ